MITPQEVGKRTREIIEDHINECGCRNLIDVQCVLTALISMAAQAVVATNGKPAAIAVLKATLIHTTLHEVPYQMETTADGDVRITVARKH